VVALSTPENQQAFDGENQRNRWSTYVLSTRLDLKESGDKVAWIERPSLSLLLFSLWDFAPRAPSSRPCISCNKQPAGVLELAELESESSPRAGNRVPFARTGSPGSARSPPAGTAGEPGGARSPTEAEAEAPSPRADFPKQGHTQGPPATRSYRRGCDTSLKN
jgi:hypothetical protein